MSDPSFERSRREEYYALCTIMLSLPTFGLSEYAENHDFGSFNLNKSEKYRLSFEDIFLGTYTKKMSPPLTVLGGGCRVRFPGS